MLFKTIRLLYNYYMKININEILKIIKQSKDIGSQSSNYILSDVSSWIQLETGEEYDPSEFLESNSALRKPLFEPTYKKNYEHLGKYIKMASLVGFKVTYAEGTVTGLSDILMIVEAMIYSYKKNYSTIEFESENGPISFVMSQEKMENIENEIEAIKKDMVNFKQILKENGATVIEADNTLKEVVALGKQIKESYNSGNKDETETKFKRFYEITKSVGRKSLPFLAAMAPFLLEKLT